MTIDKGIYIKNIYYMLTYAFRELRQNNYEDISGEDFSNIYDLFGEIMYKATAQQLKRGLHKEYVECNDVLPTVKGKINLTSTISLRIQQKLLVGCEFDIYSVDNIYNQIIKSTLNLLICTKGIKREIKCNLRKILIFFSEVSDCNLKAVRWNDIKYDRNSSTYRFLHNFCYFIAKGLLLSTEEGKYAIQHFTDDLMSRLFEKFVLNYYTLHYPWCDIRASKVEWDISRDQSTLWLLPEMRTDITLRFPGRTLIIDTKYYGQSLKKHLGKESINSGNLYQINTYIFHEDRGHTGTVDGMLLYAKTEEAITPDGQMILNTGNRIYFRNLDLNQDFSHIRNQLDSFIRPYL